MTLPSWENKLYFGDNLDVKPLQDYVHAIEKKLTMDDATEHTHRAALQALIESLLAGVSATNEPKHIECGAPDFVVRKGGRGD